MAWRLTSEQRDRLRASAGVLVLHALITYIFLTGLGAEVVNKLGDELKLFQVPPIVPPAPEPAVPAELRSKEPEGEAAPPALKATPSPVVAPEPQIRLEAPPVMVTAPLPSPNSGSDRSAGASDVNGPGTGAGGEGTGTGSGGQGTGTGGGGGGEPARRLSGSINGARDYPRASRFEGVEGTVAVQFTVQPNGRASDCTVLRSSANAELEETTCRLIEQRFRYDPARDASGRPVAEVVRRTFDWFLPRRD